MKRNKIIYSVGFVLVLVIFFAFLFLIKKESVADEYAKVESNYKELQNDNIKDLQNDIEKIKKHLDEIKQSQSYIKIAKEACENSITDLKVDMDFVNRYLSNGKCGEYETSYNIIRAFREAIPAVNRLSPYININKLSKELDEKYKTDFEDLKKHDDLLCESWKALDRNQLNREESRIQFQKQITSQEKRRDIAEKIKVDLFFEMLKYIKKMEQHFLNEEQRTTLKLEQQTKKLQKLSTKTID